MHIESRNHEPVLAGLLRTWLQSNPSWSVRQDWLEADDAPFAIFWAPPALRQASVDEIAADVVNDATLREALGFLASRDGQIIEDAVMKLWLPGWQAQLLTAALTSAWQTVLDQNRPVWQRTEVLVGAGAGVIALLTWASRRKS
jgi:hypothetical protein